CSSLQVFGRAVSRVGKLKKEVLLNSRVGQRHNLIELCLLRSTSQLQLCTNQRKRLLSQELFGSVLRRIIPVVFIVDDVDSRSCSLTIWSLNLLTNSRAGRVLMVYSTIGKSLEFLHGRKLTLGFVFVREEQHIDAVRHVVRGNSYTFEVVLIANLNTSLYESITTHV